MIELHHFTVGQLNCTVINDGNLTMRPTSIFFDGASPEALETALADHDLSADGLTFPCSCLLVQQGDNRILVDCGSGGATNGIEGELGFLFDGLDDLGISTDDITHIILSHGHFDHVAGCADDDGNPRFKNAQFFMAKDEWIDWADNDDNQYAGEILRKKLNGIKDQLQLIEPDTTIFEGVHIIATPGHTHYHVSIEFESDGAYLLCPVDVIDHPLQGQHPTWGAEWDDDREASIASRYKILQRASDTNALVHGFHFPFPGLGRFTKDGDIWQWENAT